jgi:DNA-binding MarR family transcriptional regulator
MTVDLIRELGELAFASRLKRLSDRLSRDVYRLYKSQNLNFEPRWFPVFYLLRDGRSMAVTEIAAVLGMTHPSVNQISNAMSRRGILTSSRDAADERRRLLRLTEEGKALVPELEAIWSEIRSAAKMMISDVCPGILNSISDLESYLDSWSVYDHVQERLRLRFYDSVEIVDYRPSMKKHFEALNRQWLTEYFNVEPADEAILSNPNGKIVRPGGYVIFAQINGEVVGTCGLKRINSSRFELMKMAVDKKYRGRMVGRRLAEAAISRAKSAGASEIVLETSKKLVAANNLYSKFGFVECDPDEIGGTKYGRTSVAMRLKL